MIRYILIGTLLLSSWPVDALAADEVAETVELSPTQVVAVPPPPASIESSPDTIEDQVVALATVEPSTPTSSEPSAALGIDESLLPPVVDQPITAKLLISEVRLRGCNAETVVCDGKTNKDASFVEIYNPSPEPVVITDWSLRYVVAGTGGAFGGTTSLAKLDATIDGYGYMLVSKGLPSQGIPVASLTSDIGNGSQGYVQLVSVDGLVVDTIGWGAAAAFAEGGSPTKPSELNNSMQRCETTQGRIVDTDNNKNDFLQYEVATPGRGVLCAAPQPPVAVTSCEGVHISEISANVATDQQFIELRNNADADVAIGGCQLQTNRSTVKTYILPDVVIASGGDYAAYIAGTDLTLTKTTSGTVYLLSSDGQTEVDIQPYANLAANTSWAWFGGTDWRQTYAITPGATNIDQPYLSCESGYIRNSDTGRCNKIVVDAVVACSDNQYRSEETNRCRNIVVATMLTPCKDGQYRSDETGRCRSVAVASTLTPCKAGQYRNEETNRCRTLALAGGTLIPCKDHQYRSEATNRCRAIAASSTKLVPCKDNQHRSEETNRCRAIAATAVPSAAFAVQPIADTGKAFVGWWLLGGVGLLAAGYGAWEWRREVLVGLRKVSAVVTRQR